MNGELSGRAQKLLAVYHADAAVVPKSGLSPFSLLLAQAELERQG